MDGRRDSSERLRMKVKACLVGEAAVGKTSLIRRFVLNEYDDRYVMTIGARVSKKDVRVRAPAGDLDVTLAIWDIMGVKGFRQLLQEAYFVGAQGLLAVADVTRASTLADLTGWIEAATRVAGEVPVVIAGNKEDLLDGAELGPEDIERFARDSGHKHVMTSAKTGRNVEEAFQSLAARIAERATGAGATGEPKPSRR